MNEDVKMVGVYNVSSYNSVFQFDNIQLDRTVAVEAGLKRRGPRALRMRDDVTMNPIEMIKENVSNFSSTVRSRNEILVGLQLDKNRDLEDMLKPYPTWRRRCKLFLLFLYKSSIQPSTRSSAISSRPRRFAKLHMMRPVPSIRMLRSPVVENRNSGATRDPATIWCSSSVF